MPVTRLAMAKGRLPNKLNKSNAFCAPDGILATALANNFGMMKSTVMMTIGIRDRIPSPKPTMARAGVLITRFLPDLFAMW